MYNNIAKFKFFGIEYNSGVLKTCPQVHNSFSNRFGKNFNLIQTKCNIFGCMHYTFNFFFFKIKAKVHWVVMSINIQ